MSSFGESPDTAAASAESIAQSITEIENGLCALLGETPQHIARGKFEDSEFPSELKTGVPAQLLERRPDIRSAENALASAYYGVNVAKATAVINLYRPSVAEAAGVILQTDSLSPSSSSQAKRKLNNKKNSFPYFYHL